MKKLTLIIIASLVGLSYAHAQIRIRTFKSILEDFNRDGKADLVGGNIGPVSNLSLAILHISLNTGQ